MRFIKRANFYNWVEKDLFTKKIVFLMENKKYSVVVVPTFNDTFVNVMTSIIRVW